MELWNDTMKTDRELYLPGKIDPGIRRILDEGDVSGIIKILQGFK